MKLNKIKGAISAIEGMLKIYEPLKHAEDALTELGNLEATRKALGPQVDKLKAEKAEAEKELGGVKKEVERAKYELKKNVERQMSRMNEWIIAEKKKAEIEVEKHEADLLSELDSKSHAVSQKGKEYIELTNRVAIAHKSLEEAEEKRAGKESEHSILSAKVEKLKAEMRQLAGI
jgi:chromosome segregation ATPase